MLVQMLGVVECSLSPPLPGLTVRKRCIARTTNMFMYRLLFDVQTVESTKITAEKQNIFTPRSLSQMPCTLGIVFRDAAP